MIDEQHTFEESELAQIFGHNATEPLPVRPFDIGECMLAYARSMPEKVRKDYHRWDETRWSEDWLEVEGVLSRREAHFWFWAGTCVERLEDTASERATTRTLRRVRYNGQVDRDVAVERLANWHDTNATFYRSNQFHTQAYLARVLRVLFPIGEAVEILYEAIPNRWVVAFSPYFGPLPQDEEQIAKLRSLVDEYVAGCDLNEVTNRNMVSRLAPMARHEGECRRYLEWEIARSKPPTKHAWAVLGAFEDDDVFSDYLDRLKAPMGREWVLALFSRYGFDACERINRRVAESLGRGELANLAEALGNIHSPRIVPAFLHMYLDPDASLEAEEWLLTQGPQAALGLMRHTTHRGRLREPAVELMRRIADDPDSREVIQPLLDKVDDATRRAVEEIVLDTDDVEHEELPREDLPAWLLEVQSTRKPRGMPRFISLKTLKPIYTKDRTHQLPRPAVWGLLDQFKDMTLEAHDADVLAGMRTDLDYESVREFVWSIFLDWSRHDTPTKYEWCLEMLGLIGDDTLAMRLKPFFDEWPAQGKEELSNRALEVLEKIGSDTALMMLSQLARGARFEQVRVQAQRRLEWLAAHKKIDRLELEDRIIDDCGLDSDGTYTFSFGAREFTVDFNDQLEPIVVSEEGSTSYDLPVAQDKDDTGRVDEAREEWRLMRKQLQEVVETQSLRLETSMISKRSWRPERFVKTMVEHPLMRHLTRRLVWGAYNADSELATTFRLTKTMSFEDIDESEVDVHDFDSIGVVHPISLPEKTRKTWVKSFEKGSIVSPFPQMDRDVFTVEDASLQKLELGEAPRADTLIDSLTANHWSIEEADESGLVTALARSFDNVHQIAVAQLDPGHNPEEHDVAPTTITVEFCTFASSDPLEFGEVDAIAFSEAMRQLKAPIV